MNSEQETSGRPRTPADWDARYVNGDTPWDTGRPDAHLVAAVEGRPIAPCRALDVGCGTGTDAVWLAQRGFQVTGVDFSDTALQAARARAERAGVSANFALGSFPDAAFEFAYDCGCFHTNNEASTRELFVASVARVLEPGHVWLSVSGSTDGPARDHGPPRITAADVVHAVEPHFEILSLTTGLYDAEVPTPARAWIGVFRRRHTG